MTAPENPPEYNPNIPISTNNIAESQGNFLGNFQNIYDAFIKNHIALDDPDNPGNHSVIQLFEQVQGKSTQSQEIAIYSKKVPGQTDQLFMRYPNNGKEFQLSEYQIYEIENTPSQTYYFTFLPGGIIVYFGFVTPNSNPFTLHLLPAICSNIMGVNLGVINEVARYPSNAFPIVVEGKCTGISLSNSTDLSIPPAQFYLIFGNI